MEEASEEVIKELMATIVEDALLKTSMMQPEMIQEYFRNNKDNNPWIQTYKNISSEQLQRDCSGRLISMVQLAKSRGYENMSYEKIWLDCSMEITTSMQGIIEFAKCTPGFYQLHQDDKIALLNSNIFELVVIRLSRYMDLSTGQLLLASEGVTLPEMAFYTDDIADMKLVAFVFSLAKSMAELKLTNSQLALFSALVLYSPGSAHLQSRTRVWRIHDVTMDILKEQLDRTVLRKLIGKIAKLRQASRMYKDALVRFKQRLQNFDKFPPLHREFFDSEYVPVRRPRRSS